VEGALESAVCQGSSSLRAPPVCRLSDEESRRDSRSHPWATHLRGHPVSPSLREKARACISVKNQPIRVHGQWDQTPSQTPLTTPFLSQLHACLSARIRVCVRGCRPRGRDEARRRRRLAAFSATMLRANPECNPRRSNGETIICPAGCGTAFLDFTLSTLRS